MVVRLLLVFFQFLISGPGVVHNGTIDSLPGADEDWCPDLFVGGFECGGMRSVRSATARFHRPENKAVQWLPFLNEARRNGRQVNPEF
jgi:hypothetical protein